MLISHIFKLKIFNYNRKAAIDFIFNSPLYKERVGINYRVFYIATSCIFTTSFYYYFYLKSAYLINNIINFHLY